MRNVRGKHFVIARRHPASDGSTQGGKMSKKLLSIAGGLAIASLAAMQGHAQVPGPLKLAQTIPLAGLKDGDFDHFAMAPAGKRLFLAAEDNSAIIVIDLRTKKVVGKIEGAAAPHSMGYNTETKKLY